MPAAKTTTTKKTTTKTVKPKATPKAVKPQAEDKTYRLLEDRIGASVQISSGNNHRLLYTNKDFETRAIKHCPNQRSIYVEEQDDFAKVEPIIFENGYLEVPKTKQRTQEFLDKHPSNVANKGTWFELVDEEQEAQESLEYEDLIVDLKSAVKEVSKDKSDENLQKLGVVVASLTGSLEEANSLGHEALRRIINRYIDENPYQFTDGNGNIKIFDDLEASRVYMTLTALQEGIIKQSTDATTMRWANGNDIMSCPVGTNLIDTFVEYLSTKDGTDTAQLIAKKIN